MRCFLALLRRELREACNIALVLAFVAPLALVAYEELGAHYTYPLQTAQWAIPILVALAAGVVSADIVAADVATRRVDALAALPVRLGAIWRAKLSVVVLAAVAMSLLLVATSLAQYELRAPSHLRAAFHDALLEWWFCSLAALPISFGVFAFSTAMPRGFAAGLAGLMTVGGAAALTILFDFRYYELRHVMPEVRVAVPTVVALLLLLGSYVSFTRGPVHSGTTLRRASLAVLLPLAVALPGAAFAYAGARAHIEFAPGDRDVDLHSLNPSPDGRHLAFVARRPSQRRSRVWVLDLETGGVADVPGTYTRCAPDAWSADGTLLVRELGYAVDWAPFPSDVALVRWVDPSTGDIVKTRSRDQFLAEGGRLWPPRANTARPAQPWYSGLRHRRRGDSFERILQWEGAVHVLPTNTQFLSEPGWVVTTMPDGSIAWRNLGTGEVRARVETVGRVALFPFEDASTLLLVDGPGEHRRVRLHERESGQLCGGPWTWPERTSTTVWLGRSALNGWIVLSGDSPGLWHPRTGTRISLDGISEDEAAGLSRWESAVQLSDGRLAIAVAGGIRVYDSDGTLARTYIRDID